jgi:riboflavin kinase/FMN adenylyltransferase
LKLRYALEREDRTPLVLAIGFFDGMHRGHQEIARRTLRMRRPGRRTAVLTFANHPSAFLRPGQAPPLICTPEERIDLLAAAGFEECFFVPFDDRIALQSAERFLRETLIEGLGVRGVVVGEHFRYGHRRTGDTALMERVFAEAGVGFAALENAVCADGERISSTRIRRCIVEGDLAAADQLLGHSYELRGAVRTGAGRGHGMGFPTANLAVPEKLLPADGVYSATARYDGRDYAALVSVGTNPTFGGDARTVETWLRDFEETIYGRELGLRDLRFVREQRRFESAAELQEAMKEDLAAVAYPSYG